MELLESVKTSILDHMQTVFPSEGCGVIIEADTGALEFHACSNLNTQDKDRFILDPEHYNQASMIGPIRAIVHSHCYIPAKPSPGDLVGCASTRLPWIIVSLPNKEWSETLPLEFVELPYEGRVFVHGVIDCYTLVRDWCMRERGIYLPPHSSFAWSPNWWDEGKDLYMANFAANGFTVVEDKSMFRGDIVLMALGSTTVNHAAIYVDNGAILHHVRNRLSRKDVYGGYWAKNTRAIVRRMNR